MLTRIILFSALFIAGLELSAQKIYSINSPDKKIEVKVWQQEKKIKYGVFLKNMPVIMPSSLGLLVDDMDFFNDIKLVSASPVKTVHDQYELFTGKKRFVQYKANKRAIQTNNASGEPMELHFQVSNDGFAFRYYLPQSSSAEKRVRQEFTSFRFDTTTKGFLQPMQVAKSGWEKTNPAYEEHYQKNIPVGAESTLGAGWVYPALFQTKNAWVLITEAGLDGSYCATRLTSKLAEPEYHVAFPDEREVMAFEGSLPWSRAPFYTPWRVITIGNLATIIESTLGTDIAPPVISMDKSFIRPGKSSWSWIMSKDDSIVYGEQVRYIDFAADMKWQYCLVDAAWDKKIGYDKIKELSQYAATKNVGLLLWYNSAGDWNTVKYTPKSKLLTHESRVAEFGLLKEMGIKGVKIDFFGGDGRSVIQYYIDILKDAATAGLLVNFHGATLPRGWSRTYPHLLTTEAVKGFEMVTFNQKDADEQASHCTMLPFTRNAFDPMDFTPMNLYKIPTRVKRKTTSAFELATTVLFLSGIQHLAESPAGMAQMPDYIKSFLRQLPDRWDEVRFIDGFPGQYAVIARRAGSKWFVAGINGENTDRTVLVNLAAFKKLKAQLITDGEESLTFRTQQINPSLKKEISLKPNGGFILVLED